MTTPAQAHYPTRADIESAFKRISDAMPNEAATIKAEHYREVARIAELEAEAGRLKAGSARLLKAAQTYRDNYLLDEIDEPELCISREQHSMLLDLNAAIDSAIAASKGA